MSEKKLAVELSHSMVVFDVAGKMWVTDLIDIFHLLMDNPVKNYDQKVLAEVQRKIDVAKRASDDVSKRLDALQEIINKEQ